MPVHKVLVFTNDDELLKAHFLATLDNNQHLKPRSLTFQICLPSVLFFTLISSPVVMTKTADASSTARDLPSKCLLKQSCVCKSNHLPFSLYTLRSDVSCI